MVGRFQVIPAVYVLLVRGSGAGTEVLLQLRGRTGFRDGHWAAAAAGHVEYGESVYAAAAREAAEELGVALRREDLEPLCAIQRTEPGNADPVEQRVDYFLTARAWQGEPRILEHLKCLELRWCPLDDLPEPLVPHEQEVLRLLATGHVPPIVTFGFDPPAPLVGASGPSGLSGRRGRAPGLPIGESGRGHTDGREPPVSAEGGLMPTREDTTVAPTDTAEPPLPEPDVKPSSTPSGPQVIPSPSTPPGEPGPDPAPERAGFEVRDSNPNAAGPEGLSGGMGVSSERTGPLGEDPRTSAPVGESIEGTGSYGGAVRQTEGSVESAPGAAPETPRVHPEDPAEGAEDEEVTEETGADNSYMGIDRTVGESNTAQVPPHPHHPERNPGHSHG